MKLNISQIAVNVKVLGYGSRVGVWVQHCSIGCPGCSSVHTHDRHQGHLLTPTQIIDWLGRQHHRFDGLTISGGEPSEQAEGVIALIKAYREAYEGDVLCFTGLPWRLLNARYSNFIDNCDIVIAGPYIESLPALPLRGSSNQTIHLLTELAHTRYHDINTWSVCDSQVAFNEKQIITVGIPNLAEQTQLINNNPAFDSISASWYLPN